MDYNPNQNQPDAPYTCEPIGGRLRQQREQMRLNLEEAAKQLRLDRKILLALEGDDFNSLPSPAYIKGYLRSYAQLLGMDAQGLISDYQKLTCPVDPEFKPPIPLKRDYQTQRGRLYWVGSVIALLLVLVSTWWYAHSNTPVSKSPSLSENVTVEQKQPRPATSIISPSSPVSQPKPSLAQPQAITPSLPPASTQPAKATVNPLPSISRQNAKSNDQSKIRVKVNPLVAVQSQLILTLTHRSWVQIDDAKGKRLAYGMLPAGTHQTLEGVSPFSVFLGYASGAQLSVDGHQIKIVPFIRANHTARLKVQAPAVNSAQ